MVDAGRDEWGRPPAFRCLDPGWQDGHTKFAGQDCHLRAHVYGEAWSPVEAGLTGNLAASAIGPSAAIRHVQDGADLARRLLLSDVRQLSRHPWR
jgi:hypothetical protein